MRAVLLLLALAAPAAPAQDAPAPARYATPLARRIDAILDQPAFEASFWGVEIREVRSGRVLYARNAEKNMKPASTQKVVTTAAALDAFGPQERFRTTIETPGRVDATGRVIGDLLLVGGGDPNLSGRFHAGRGSAPLEELAEALRAAGVRRIEGRVIGHEGLFQGDRRGEDWAWGDLVWSYGAEVSALSFNDNTAQLSASAGEKAGDPLVVDHDPRNAHYAVTSTAVTSPAGTLPALVLRADPGANLFRLSGSLPFGGEPWAASVAIADPARYAAVGFAEALAAKGIRVMGAVATSSDPLPAGLRVLATRESEPMAEILKVVNKRSQNLHTEMLLRLLGARVKGQGTVEAGHEAAADFLARNKVPAESWDLRDASGLSRSDVITPHGLVALLTAMDRHPHAGVFRDSLAVAGVDGTLEDRMKGTAAQGRVLGKTGSIRAVNALAGYATHRGGERLAFAIVLNHHTAATSGVGAIDEIATALVR